MEISTPGLKTLAQYKGVVPRDGRQLGEMLADIEGLTGPKRSAFVDMFDNVFCRVQTDRRRCYKTAFVLIPAGPLVIVGSIAWVTHANTRHLLTMILTATISTILSLLVLFLLFKRDERKALLRPFEQEWAGYCSFIRPKIIQSKPGFLDRNLPAAKNT